MRLLILFIVFTYISIPNKDTTSKTNGIRPFPTAHIISIGINGFLDGDSIYQFKNAESDAQKFTSLIENDSLLLYKYVDTIKNERLQDIPKLSIHKLIGSIATKSNLKDALLEIKKVSKPDDYFIFFYAGYAFTDYENEKESFITIYEKEIDSDSLELSQFKLRELSEFMNGIQSKKQLFISEAGSDGQRFSNDLVSYFIESDPYIAAATERNRIIISNVSLAYDGSNCDSGTGPLLHMISKSKNLLDIFYNTHQYEFRLSKLEIECTVANTKYFTITRENRIREVLQKSISNLQTRGIEGLNFDTVSDNDNPKNIALIIATNEYKASKTWKNLRNPINDAEIIGKILEEKYNTQIVTLYNPTIDSVKKKLLEIKNSVDERSRVLLFFAGHGYFSSIYSDGYLVFKDSKEITDETYLENYLAMSTLERMINSFSSKHVFVIFDVCFGSSFEPNSRDIEMNNYENLLLDITIDEFIERKSKEISRLYLASGKYEVPDYWKDSKDHSPFADKLITILNEEQEFISPGKIYSRIEGNITEPILKQFGEHSLRSDFILKVEK